MSTDVIDPISDPRISHKTAILNSHTYHYLLGVPKNGEYRATVFLIHGWPDLSMGWRYQIPMLLQMRLRVVCPDLMGFGGTDAPRVPPESIHLYGYKRAAGDIAELAKQLGAGRIVLGGHDWGGMVVWRTALWYPELVTHVFSICTPFLPPNKNYISLEDIVKGPLPQFGYQIHLSGPEVGAKVQTREQVRQFLNGMYGGRGPKGELLFNPEKGILFENLEKVGQTRLLNNKEIGYYVDQYFRNGLHGTLNWYRTRKANWEDELQLERSSIDVPTMFIQATRDNVLTPAMSVGMEKHLPKLKRYEVSASHWVLWEKPGEVNGFIREWLDNVLPGARSSL